MWHKIRELVQKKLNKSQIAAKLGIDRHKVATILAMSEAEWMELVNAEASPRPSMLDKYESEVLALISDFQFMSAPQIEDHLKEKHEDFPEVSTRTVYNFVMKVRNKYNLPKADTSTRQYAMIPLCDPGEEAQVDYGEYNMPNVHGTKTNVHFIVVTSCYSRAKFAYFQSFPFTAKTTVYGLHLAFEYFGGVFKNLIFDQDVKVLKDENLGDYLLTAELASYVPQAGFTAVLCHARDPQSKGYVKTIVT